MLMELYATPDVPLLLKEDPRLPPLENALWKERFREAVKPSFFGDWLTAESRLSALAAETAASEIWSELAMVRGWLDDSAGCTAALRR